MTDGSLKQFPQFFIKLNQTKHCFHPLNFKENLQGSKGYKRSQNLIVPWKKAQEYIYRSKKYIHHPTRPNLQCLLTNQKQPCIPEAEYTASNEKIYHKSPSYDRDVKVSRLGHNK